MQIPKLKVLVEAGAVREVEAIPEESGWTVQVTYASRHGERREILDRQRGATATYQPPTWTRRVMEHTSVFVRAASGTSSTVSDSGDTTTSSPMTVGIQVNIPLASPREQGEFAHQALAEATRIDEVRNRALTDLGKLRELEAERAAGQERLA